MSRLRVVVGEVVAAAGAARKAAAADPGVGAAAVGALAVLDEVATVLGVARAEVAGVVRESGSWRRTPAGRRAGDFTRWRADSSRQGVGVARGEEQAGEILELLPRLRDAAQRGEVTEGHVRVVATVLAGVDPATRERLAGREVEIVARAKSVAVPVLRRELQGQAAALEAAKADASYEAARKARFLRLTARGEVVRVEGALDVLSAATLRTALDAVTPVPADGDERNPDQRRADALVLLADRALGVGVDKAGAQVRPHLSILVRQDTWLLLHHLRRTYSCAAGGEAAGERGTFGDVKRGGADASVAGGAAPSDGVSTGGNGAANDAANADGDAAHRDAAAAAHRDGAPTGSAGSAGSGLSEAYARSGLEREPVLAELLDGTLVPFAALDVVACDAMWQRVVLDAEGVPLDVGQTERTYTRDLRRAVLVRDRHCQWPGCVLRAAWCEVHHVIEWNQGGDTSLVNAVTLCREHHHRVHRDHTRITPTRGGFTFTTADGQRIGATTRLDDELLVPKPRPEGEGRTLPTAGPGDDGRGGGGSSGGDGRGGAAPGTALPGGERGGGLPGGGSSGGDVRGGAAPGGGLPSGGAARGGALPSSERGGGLPGGASGSSAAPGAALPGGELDEVLPGDRSSGGSEVVRGRSTGLW
ncbi:HNH endonuclease signature motif containing protein [Miniimonas sp. S16]|uniref:HNH endonuclease signature motif containing protein n=1 Tax=Miniimonas sp. S16 TaxID=2171623 RepID=UPI00131EEDB3|nr:HNH endonuclease signature motif containing protein [Miniimonas sp. S16]